MRLNIETRVEDIRDVSANRRYWFVRTYSGILFHHFVQEEYIGIGFNNVPQEYISKAELDNDHSKVSLKEFIENNTNYEKGEATKWANQLINFQKGMNIGDVVLIPSKNSSDLAIGVIQSSVYLVKDPGIFEFGEKYERYPEKRRKVSWKIEKQRPYFRNDLNSIFNSRQAISSIDELGNTIESYISNLFTKGNRTYFTISINKDEDINAFYFRDFLDSLTYFYTEICREFDKENFDPENLDNDLFIKIKVQSKGRVALSAVSIVGALGIGLITVLAQNPQLKLDIGNIINLDVKSDGFLPAISDFLDRNQERKMKFERFVKSMEELEANDSIPASDDQIPDDEEE